VRFGAGRKTEKRNRMLTSEQVKAKCDPHLGRPFVIAPGYPPQHRVVWKFQDGTKLRAGDVMQVWNDALLMEAIEGKGSYLKTAKEMETRALWVAEMLYGLTLDEMFNAWLNIPKYTTPCIWAQGAKEWPC
jgi:hypothetical protein